MAPVVWSKGEANLKGKIEIGGVNPFIHHQPLDISLTAALAPTYFANVIDEDIARMAESESLDFVRRALVTPIISLWILPSFQQLSLRLIKLA